QETVTLPGTLGTYDTVPCVDVPLEAAVVSMGTFGIVLAYVLEVRERYRLAQDTHRGPRSAMLALARAYAGARHVELLLRPDRDEAVLIVRREVPLDTPANPPDGPPAALDAFKGQVMGTVAGALVSRQKDTREHVFDAIFANQEKLDGTCADWDGILVRDTGMKAHGFEVFFPVAALLEGVEAVMEGVHRAERLDKAPTTAPMGVRFVKAGPHWLSMTHEELWSAGLLVRTDVWVSVEVPRLLGSRNHTRIPDRILEILRERAIPHRPHWGQYFPTEAVDPEALYPALPAWREARARFAASDRFLTPELARLLGIGGQRAPLRPALDAPNAPQGRRILVLHGESAPSTGWPERWTAALDEASSTLGAPPPTLRFLAVDDLFADPGLTGAGVEAALHDTMAPLFRYRSSRDAGRSWLSRAESWSADRTATWLGSTSLQEALRERVAFLLDSFRPELVVAHGVGGLVAYDVLSVRSAQIRKAAKEAGEPVPRGHLDLLTFGTPIGHPALRRVWGGRLQIPAELRRWMHLDMPDDPAPTAPIPLAGVTDLCLRAEPGFEPGDPEGYLRHPRVLREVWRPLLTERAAVDVDFRTRVRKAARRPRKALIVGIDRYASAGMQLEGCVNDAFAVSAMLQTRFDYAPSDIRLLTNEHATVEAFRERLAWLLGDADDDDRRVLWFSGHGAQLPSYNALEVVDQVDECLVLHDFDWHRPETAFVDDELAAFYSQLPFGVRFTAVLDCCHAGGMARATGARARGIVPPDDIRHRMLAFDRGQWGDRFEARRKPVKRRDLVTAGQRPELKVGTLGGGLALRPDREDYVRLRTERGHGGPFMPLLATACAEGQLAFEHTVGSASHGAFTWALLERLARSRKTPTFQDLVEGTVAKRVQALGYAQTPEVSGPRERREQAFEL
ncbi:MAG: caspase family protein, partial [Myxococcales bacterium]|nr:caspase family protein [Myxococcales bacterium]